MAIFERSEKEPVKYAFIYFAFLRETHSGIKDVDVLAIAVESNAFLLTEDKDFGELVFRLHLSHKGILLIRFPNDYEPDIKAQKVVIVYSFKINSSHSMANKRTRYLILGRLCPLIFHKWMGQYFLHE